MVVAENLSPTNPSNHHLVLIKYTVAHYVCGIINDNPVHIISQDL